MKEIVSNLSLEEFKEFVEWYESERQKKLNGKEKKSLSKDEQADEASAGGVKLGLIDYEGKLLLSVYGE